MCCADPPLINIWRGPEVESRHHGVVAIARADGENIFACGDVERAVYPRSAIKALQAIPLIESGAARRFALSHEELAIACASHGGEPGHVSTVSELLARIGLTEEALACGAHWPSDETARYDMVRKARTPTRIHNNCSGKHAGMLAVAVHLGFDTDGYELPEHPVQAGVRAVLADMTGASLAEAPCGIDGCSVPTWALPPRSLAVALARFATGEGLRADRAEGCARLRRACAKAPWHVAGSGRFCSVMMSELGEAIFVKGGAEGVYCGAVPHLGLGIALKITDGARRASEAVMAAILEALLPESRSFLTPLVTPPVTNWRGLEVGRICPTDEFRAALETLS